MQRRLSLLSALPARSRVAAPHARWTSLLVEPNLFRKHLGSWRFWQVSTQRRSFSSKTILDGISALVAQLSRSVASGRAAVGDLATAEKALLRLPAGSVDINLLVQCIEVVGFVRLPLEQFTVCYLRAVRTHLLAKLDADKFAMSVNQVAICFKCISRLGESSQICQDYFSIFGKIISQSPDVDQLDDVHFRKLFGALSTLQADSPTSRLFVKALGEKLSQRQTPWTGSHLAAALYGVQNMTADMADLRHLLAALIRRPADSAVIFTGPQLGNLLYGLKSMSYEISEVQEVLAIAVKALRDSKNPVQMSEQDVCLALYGLNKMGTDHHVADILNELAARLEALSSASSARCVSMALYGLQNKADDLSVMRRLLRVLTARAAATSPSDWTMVRLASAFTGIRAMRSCSELNVLIRTLNKFIPRDSGPYLDSRAICNILNGARHLYGASPEVLETVRRVASLLSGSKSSFSAQGISNMLYSMSSMTSAEVEIVQLVHALIPHVHRCEEAMTADEMASAIYGMQGLNSKVSEVSALIEAVASIVQRGEKQKWSANNVATAMYGMRSMSDRNKNVCQLLTALKPHIASCQETLNGYQLGRSFFGLRVMTCSHVATRYLLLLLTDKLARSASPLSPPELVNCIKGTFRIVGDCPEYLNLVKVLRDKVTNCEGVFSHDVSKEAVKILIRDQAASNQVKNARRELAVAIIQKTEKADNNNNNGDIEITVKANKIDNISE